MFHYRAVTDDYLQNNEDNTFSLPCVVAVLYEGDPVVREILEEVPIPEWQEYIGMILLQSEEVQAKPNFGKVIRYGKKSDRFEVKYYAVTNTSRALAHGTFHITLEELKARLPSVNMDEVGLDDPAEIIEVEDNEATDNDGDSSEEEEEEGEQE